MPTQTKSGGWKYTQYTASGAVQTSSQGTSLSESLQHDVVKPARRPKPAPPLLATPYKLTHDFVLYPKGKMIHYLANGGRREISGILTLTNTTASGIPWTMSSQRSWDSLQSAGSDIESVAITKALNKLRTNGGERETTFDPGVAWRERNELGALYRDVSSRTVNGLDAVLNLDYKRTARAFGGRLSPRQCERLIKDAVGGISRKSLRAPGALANAWLALKMGYLPFISDLHGAAEALAYRSEKHHWDIEVNARATRRETHFRKDSDTTSTSTWKHVHYRNSETLTRSATVGFTAMVDDEFDHKLAQLGLNNPASILYESTPLTCIADYFFDTGNWLSALGAPFGCKFRTGFTTQYLEWTMELSDAGKDYGTSWRGSRRSVKWERKVLTNWPVPIAPLARNPSGLNASKITTLAALVYSRFMPRSGRGTDFQSVSNFRFTD